MTPIIGVAPLYDDKRDRVWIVPEYMDAVTDADGAPVMLHLTQDEATLARYVQTCDGLLLTGGHDVDPAVYGAATEPECGQLCPRRDGMEALLIDAFLAADKPVFGICRGLQILNAHLGGTLYQHLPRQLPSEVEHQMQPPYDRTVHSVDVTPGTPLSEILGAGSIEVNSLHHQGVWDVAPSLAVCATAPDGLVEGLYMPGKRFVLAVQWHPEYSFKSDENCRKLFAAFLQACQHN